MKKIKKLGRQAVRSAKKVGKPTELTAKDLELAVGGQQVQQQIEGKKCLAYKDGVIYVHGGYPLDG